MSLYLVARVFHTQIKNPIDKLVLLALADHAWDDGTNVRPSQARLRAYTGVSNGAINASLARLVNDGRLSPSDGMPYPFGKAGLVREFCLNVSGLGEPVQRRAPTSPADGEVSEVPKNISGNVEAADRVFPTSPAGGEVIEVPESNGENSDLDFGTVIAIESTAVDLKPLKLVFGVDQLLPERQKSAGSPEQDTNGCSAQPTKKRRAKRDGLPSAKRDENGCLQPEALTEEDRDNNPARYLLTIFELAFQDKIGFAHPPLGVLEDRLAKSTVRRYGINRGVKLIESFFELIDDDEFIARAGPSFRIFYASLTKLLRTPRVDSVLSRANFNKFWAVWPKDVDRSGAMKAWVRLAPSVDLTAKILAAVQVQKVQPGWTKADGEFIPHASTWLNGKRWNDAVQESSDPYAKFPRA